MKLSVRRSWCCGGEGSALRIWDIY